MTAAVTTTVPRQQQQQQHNQQHYQQRPSIKFMNTTSYTNAYTYETITIKILESMNNSSNFTIIYIPTFV